MKQIRSFILICIALFSTSITKSQMNDEYYDQLMWGRDTDEALVTKVPEKWKDESAVYLFYYEKYKYRKQSMNNAIDEEIYFRSRIKLLDQAAVNVYSQLSMDKIRNSVWGGNANYLGIKIIKPNGNFRIISENDFVETKSKQNGYRAQRTMKLALPNLAIGDIIDTYYVSINSYTTIPRNLDIAFNPVMKLLQKEYPILYGELIINPERKTYFNAKSINGAPQPDSVENEKWKNYVYQYGDIEKTSIDQMVFPLREYPGIIYQIIMTTKAKASRRNDFLGENGVLKSEISLDELKGLLIKLTDFENIDSYAETMSRTCYSKVKKQLENNPSKSEILEDCFYFLRHYLHFKYTYYYSQLTSMSTFIPDYDFIMAFSNILDRFKIQHEIGLAIDRQYGIELGEKNDAILSSQLVPFIRIIEDSTIITYPSTNSVYGENISMIEGTNALILDKKTADLKNPAFRFDSLKISLPKDNLIIDSINITLGDLKNPEIKINENYSCKGNLKLINYNLIVPFFSTYHNESIEYLQYNTFSKADFSKIKEYEEGLEKYKEEYLAERHNNVLQYLRFSQIVEDIDLDTVIVSSFGRWTKEDTLKYHLEYSYKTGINVAGNYYLVDIGKFIGRNKEFAKEELDRKVDIYNPSPVKYNWVITMDIPEGYKIESVKDLNYKVDNSEGSFNCSAKIADNKLIINARKIYKRNFSKKEKWPEVLEFLQAALDFTQKQVLLSPVN
ncbi:MAG: DUF3857 domain-containing protein [Chlorobi bacterium]|nr:DUF3857 domain-containing protein [Chlorobiota bacterium]